MAASSMRLPRGSAVSPRFVSRTAEYIGQPPSGPYTYTINTGAVEGGGPGGGANAIDPNTGLPMDNISLGTAWLFSQFSAGTLTLDNGSGSYFDTNRLANAGELQQAIWYLEDENNGVNNGYVSLAETALGTDLTGVKADSNGEFGVVALNLFDCGRQPGSGSVGGCSRTHDSRLLSAGPGCLGFYPTLCPKTTFLNPA